MVARVTHAAEYDLAVVGGGIVGAMVSHYAKRLKPRPSQVVFDRFKFGAGATSLSGGLMPLVGQSPSALSLAARSRALYADLFTLGDEAPVRCQPTYWVVPKERQQQLYAALGRERDGQVDTNSSGTPHSLVVPAGYTTVRDDSVWAADAEVAARLLLAQAAPGDQQIEGVSVDSIEGQADAFRVHRRDGLVTTARRVILAPGPWILKGPTAQWAREAGVRVKRTVCLHLRERTTGEFPALVFFAERAFLLPQPKLGRSLFSYTAEEWDVEPIHGDLGMSQKDRAVALGILDRFLPSRVADYIGGQVFCDAYTPEQSPRVGLLGDQAGCVVVGACSGSGVRLAPGLAQQALELAFHGETKGAIAWHS